MGTGVTTILSGVLAVLLTVVIVRTVMGRLEWLWFNRHGLLRVVWRLPIFFLLLVSLGFGVISGVRLLLAAAGISPDSLSGGDRTIPAQILGYTLLVLTLFAVSAICVRFLDRRPLAGLGLGLGSRWLRQLGLGLSLGALAVTTIIGLLSLAGAFRFRLTGVAPSQIAFNFLLALLMLTGVSFFEELLFRGYLLQVLAEGIGDFLEYLLRTGEDHSGPRKLAERCGRIIAALLLAAPFGVAHYANEGGTAIGALATGMAGLLLALAYFRTRSLWLPIGLHTGWNLFMGWVYSATLSGTKLPTTLFETSSAGPEWLTGGSFGPEASLPAFLAMALLALYVLRSRRADPGPEAVAWYPPQESRRPTPPDPQAVEVS